MVDGTTLYYVHPDNLDRPVVMTNAAAMTVAWAAKYDPFGVPVAVTVTPVNNMRFPGQWFQSEDGLSYNWHRTYDPTLGRYTQADPLGFVDGPGIYNYAGSSPVLSIDPEGLQQQMTLAPWAQKLAPFVLPAAEGPIGICLAVAFAILTPTPVADAECLPCQEHAGPLPMAEHTKNATPSNRPTHEKGESRRKQDRGGEKGDAKRTPNRKRTPGHKGPWPSR